MCRSAATVACYAAGTQLFFLFLFPSFHTVVLMADLFRVLSSLSEVQARAPESDDRRQTALP